MQYQLFLKAKIFFCPSLYVERFVHVVVEAGMCGTPILCTDFGAFTETVLPGKTGFRCRTFQDYIDGVKNIDLTLRKPSQYKKQLHFDTFNLIKLLHCLILLNLPLIARLVDDSI